MKSWVFLILVFLVVSCVYTKPTWANYGDFKNRFGVTLMSGHKEDWTCTNELGGKWARLNPDIYARWFLIEPVKNQYDWTKVIQERVSLGDQFGFTKGINNKNIMGILLSPPYPNWVTSVNNGWSRIPASKYGEAAEFAKKVVEMWDGDGIGDTQGSHRIGYWEIINEPDFFNIMGNWGGYGREYGEFLKVIYTAIKQADPSAKVTTGSFALSKKNPVPGANDNIDPNFLDDFLSVPDIGNYFDYFNFHYYEVERDDWAIYGPGLIGKSIYVNKKLREKGINKPLIISETTAATGQAIDGKIYNIVDQADFIHKMAARSLAVANLSQVNWWEILDNQHFDVGVGLYNRDPNRPDYPGAIKPAGNNVKKIGRFTQNADNSTLMFGKSSALPIREGYQFPSGRQIWWKNNGGNIDHTVVAKKINIIKTNETTQLIEDGGVGDKDGLINGEIKIELSLEPLYVDVVENSTKLFGTVGFEHGAWESNGVDFGVWVQDGNNWKSLSNIKKVYDGTFVSFEVNLSSYVRNNKVSFIVGVDAAGNASSDWATYKDLKLRHNNLELDLISQAVSANWHTRLGSYSFSNTPPSGGSVQVKNIKLENGNTYKNVLFVHPNWAADGFMHGGFNVSLSCLFNSDINGDGKVNTSDLLIWYQEYKSGVVNRADFNCDGKVNMSDLIVWYTEYKK